MSLIVLVDRILQRKRCPFCVAPFPVFKCVNFDQWRCPQCETDFSMENGELEPLFDDSLMKMTDSSAHFPASQSVNSLLCSSCSLNQQKIIQLLNAFEGTTRQQTEYSKRIESKYPLCATCNYRVSQRLQQCQEQALHYQRQHSFPSTAGADWRSKLKLAQQMRWKQLQRKLLRASFFAPELLFQSGLIALVLHASGQQAHLKHFISFDLAPHKSVSLWLPTDFSFSSNAVLLASLLFCWQIMGAGWHGRGVNAVITQLFSFALRVLVLNFLFNADDCGISRFNAAVLAAMGLAIVVRCGSSNGFARPARIKHLQVIQSQSIKETPIIATSSLLSGVNQETQPFVSDGFSRYAAQEHRYHSFANTVSGDVKPWPVKPRPGNLKPQVKQPDFNSLASSFSSQAAVRLRPTQLTVEDPLELEPMFSSFSLNDSPVVIKKQKEVTQRIRSPEVVATDKTNRTVKNVTTSISWKIAYNLAITISLLTCRILVRRKLSLVAVVLAAAFGLRGFVWPRLSTRVQILLVSVALLRLLLLTGELNEQFRVPSPIQLIFDIILITIR